jgi:hypothetical protein
MASCLLLSVCLIARFCDSCFRTMHAKGRKREHTVTRFPGAAAYVGSAAAAAPGVTLGGVCVECEYAYATRTCDTCTDSYCDACFDTSHAKGSKRHHTWQPVAYAAAAMPAVAVATSAAAAAWQTYVDESSGLPYYYNWQTGETSWTLPY